MRERRAYVDMRAEMDGSALRPERQTAPRRSAAHCGVEALAERINQLVRERQELRRGGAGIAVLERNRVELAETQRGLSRALIDRHLSSPTAA